MPSTPATNAIGVELQAVGENLNTWGNPKLTNSLQVLVNLASKWLAVALADGTNTVSETNYSVSNSTEVAFVKFTGGSLTAAASWVIPGRSKRIICWNAEAYAITVKLSATTGVSIPASRIVWIATDGTADVYNASPTYVGTGYTVTNNGDVANKIYVDTAIATASLPATSGTILVDGADTTAGYINTKLSVTGSGAATVTPSITSPGGNETKVFAISVGTFGLSTGAVISATGTTAAVNTRYQVDKSTSYTITLPAAPARGDVVQFEMSGTGGLTTFGLNSLKYYGITTNPSTSGEGVQTFVYTTAARGWVDA